MAIKKSFIHQISKEVRVSLTSDAEDQVPGVNDLILKAEGLIPIPETGDPDWDLLVNIHIDQEVILIPRDLHLSVIVIPIHQNPNIADVHIHQAQGEDVSQLEVQSIQAHRQPLSLFIVHIVVVVNHRQIVPFYSDCSFFTHILRIC